ncbi:MAG: glutathione S-transferase family protein [Alphaproteobacteria bacterium]|nr:glutathione S-transferase family protein [Alphaproteobacteria bacterium]
MLKLYYAPGTCALASHIALEEAGARYETVRLNFKTEDQKKPEYLKINPKARVPALVTNQGFLTETPAILYYIAQTHPAAKLAPSDPFLLGKAQAFNSYLCSTVHVAHAHRMRGRRWVDDEASILAMQKKVPQTVGECFALIEREMFAGPWVMGKEFSICDGYLFTLTQWLDGDGVDVTRTPKIADHFKRMSERPAVKKAVAEETQPLQSAA